MKKLFTLCLSFLLGGLAFNAQAQVDDAFQFCEEDGTVIPDGSRIIRNHCEQTPQGYNIHTNIYVKNVGGVPGGVNASATVNTMTVNGMLSFCYPESCKTLTGPGVISNNDVARDNGPVSYNKKFDAHWTAYGQGECEVTYQLFRYSAMSGDETFPGSTITVLYTTDPNATGINGVTTTESREIVARYTLDGQLLSAPQKGINIVKYADGRTAKVLVKD